MVVNSTSERCCKDWINICICVTKMKGRLSVNTYIRRWKKVGFPDHGCTDTVCRRGVKVIHEWLTGKLVEWLVVVDVWVGVVVKLESSWT